MNRFVEEYQTKSMVRKMYFIILFIYIFVLFYYFLINVLVNGVFNVNRGFYIKQKQTLTGTCWYSSELNAINEFNFRTNISNSTQTELYSLARFSKLPNIRKIIANYNGKMMRAFQLYCIVL